MNSPRPERVRRRSILIISQTVSLPARRRTWQQATALVAEGWRVRVLCPRGPQHLRHETIEGVEISRFPQPFEGRDRLGLLFEYGLALVSLSIAIVRERLRGALDVIQVVNPPDWLIGPASLLKPFGTRIVLDLADLSTSLYEAKFGKRGSLYVALVLVHHWALCRADLVVAANEAYRRVAVSLGRRRPGATVAIHSYPERLPDLPAKRRNGPLRIGYFGVLGPQDGVELLLAAAAQLNALPGLPAFEVVVVGDGPNARVLHRLSAALDLEERVRFLGFLEGAERDAALADFDVAVATDPLNRYTRLISMNKIFVYAAAGLPIVCTPLPGTRRLLGDAATYTGDCSCTALVAALKPLLCDSLLRRRMGARARQRAETDFNWRLEAALYTRAIARLLGDTASHD